MADVLPGESPADGQAGPQQPDPPELAQAQRALESGDYGACLRGLTPLADAHGASTPLGGRIRLLMATALMGQGDAAAAAACCRSLRGCKDLILRQQARDLEEVLEAPALQRPRNWSVQMPSLGELLLTTLLAGCVQLETSLRFPAPGRLQITQTSTSATGQTLPWQRDLARALGGGSVVVERDHGRQSLRNRVLPAGQALAWLGQSLERGAALAGVSLPKPELELHERNWLIGVQQRMELAIDLRAVEALPGLDLSFRFAPLEARAVERATPKPVQLGPGAKELHWPLEPGALNRLTWRTWRWSRLGLGAVAVALVLGLALLLQRLRLRAGFGFPQLPA